MQDYSYTVNKSEYDQILSHLILCNNLFVPPLQVKVDIHEYSQKLESLATRFEAWFNSELIGLVAVYMNDPLRKIAFITNVSVDNRHTGKGIARQLLTNCIRSSVENEFYTVELEVSKGNIKAIELYQTLGFNFLEETPNDSVKLALRLTEKN